MAQYWGPLSDTTTAGAGQLAIVVKPDFYFNNYRCDFCVCSINHIRFLLLRISLNHSSVTLITTLWPWLEWMINKILSLSVQKSLEA